MPWLPHRALRTATAGVCLCAGLAAGCESSTRPAPIAREFVIEHVGERFAVRVTDADSIRHALENLQGRNSRFPTGTLRPGNGGFNSPWTWHLDPDSVRFVEAAIEICDGRASYVETHQADYPTFCPWGARVVAER